MRRVLLILWLITIVIPLPLGVSVVLDSSPAAVAQEYESATPPADTATPPDNIETSTPMNWGLIGLGVLIVILGIIIGVYLDRRSRRAQATRRTRTVEYDQPPPDESTRR